MRYVPEVMVIPEDVLAEVSPVLEFAARSLERRLESTPGMKSVAERNGWSPRALAWGLLIRDWADGIDFDATRLPGDEEGAEDEHG